MKFQIKSPFSLLLVVILALCHMSSRPITAAERYVEQFKEIAIREMNRSGIPASIKLAQGIFESASGNSPLAINANNHFGIKCKTSWTGETYLHKDDDFDETGNLKESCFRKYTSPEESYIDHTEFLMNRERYKALFALDKTDYIAWATGLKNCGYATDPNYSNKIIETIKKYNLDYLDKTNDPSIIVINSPNPSISSSPVPVKVSTLHKPFKKPKASNKGSSKYKRK